MKKMFLLAGAVLVSAIGMAQVKDVKKAQGLALSEVPNFEQARQLIEGAKTNPETKDQANTWYVAGLIGYQQSETELNKRYLGQQADFNVIGEAQKESYACWLKADELASVLVQDKKGNMVMDKKNVTIKKNIATKMLDYWNNQGLLGYAGTFYENKDYATTYELYKLYIDIPNLPVMQDEKTQAKMLRDTMYADICQNAGVLAYFAEKYEESAAVFAELLKSEHRTPTAGEYLYSCYLNMKDSVKAYEVMDQCIAFFPNVPTFMQARISAYVGQKDYDNAVALLDKAIAQDPQIQYFNSKGTILTVQGKYDQAVETFKQGLAIEPNNAELYCNYGFVFVEKGNKLNEEAAYLSDKEYAKARQEFEATYKQALPLFEKAHQLDSDNDDFTRSLKSLYYRLGMIEEYNAL